MTLTGFGAAESSLGVAKDGSVFYAPAFGSDGIGVAVTKDEGATWQHQVPTLPAGVTRSRVQPYMYLDPSTDELFFLTSQATSGTTSGENDAGGFDLSVTSDEGSTWDYESVAHDAVDWTKIFAGPAVTSQPQGYPNILYMTAPSPISTPSPFTPAPDHQSIYTSLDGGKTWQSVGSLSLKPADVPGCEPNEWVIFGTGVVAPDGTAYLGFRRCAHLGVGTSRDEGKTWAVADVTGADLPPFDTSGLGIINLIGDENVLVSEPFAVDSDGTLYAVWVDATKNTLRLAFSKNHAQSWSSSVVISAPKLAALRFGAVTVKSPGTIAIAYYGSPDGKKFDGVVAESTDALDAAPTFTSVTVNDPASPLFSQGFDSGYANTLDGGDLIEFVQVRYAASGDVWASFVKEMCPGGTSSACTWDYSAHASSIYQGAVGRVIHR
jgi:hypothetical protein